MMIGAPVGSVELLWLDREVAESDFATMHMKPGILHGSVFLDEFEPSYEIEHMDEPDNAHRFARLAVLYGWAFADDHQYLYRRSSPHLVASVDHDYFLFGAPEWDPATLLEAPAAEPDKVIVEGAFLSREVVALSAEVLKGVESDAIADAVALLPASWGVGLDERVALASYFEKRRRQLLDAVR